MNNRRENPSYFLDSRLDLLQSNPVLWLRSFAASLKWDRPADVDASTEVLGEIIQRPPLTNIQFPNHELRRIHDLGWIRHVSNQDPVCGDPTAFVVGLVANSHDSYVVPLKVNSSSGWRISPLLPFGVTEIQTAMSLFTRELSVPSVVPERYEFDIDTPLRSLLVQESPQGPSMNLAALVALLVTIETNRNECFDLCCVSGTLTDNGAIVRSGFAMEKMEAFRREYNRGTLLIRPSDCQITSNYDQFFDRVFAVSHLRDLVRCLQALGQLDTLTNQRPLSPHEMQIAVSRLETFVYTHRDYRSGVDLADRLRSCPRSPQVAFEDRHRLLSLSSEVHRHTGNVAVATATAEEMYEALRSTGDGTSYDQIAGADVASAASLFDLTRYDEMLERLLPWVEKLKADPLVFRPLTRVILQNTVGRAWCAIGDQRGLDLFHRSIKIQSDFFPSDVARTENYLIYYATKLGQTEIARKRLDSEDRWNGLSPISRQMRAFVAAELARHEDRKWDTAWMDSPDQANPGWGGPFAFYALATARQRGRTTADADARFFHCETMLKHDLRDQHGISTLHTLLSWVRLARFVYRQDDQLAGESANVLAESIAAYPDQAFQTFHRSMLARFKRNATRSNIDKALDSVPMI